MADPSSTMVRWFYSTLSSMSSLTCVYGIVMFFIWVKVYPLEWELQSFCYLNLVMAFAVPIGLYTTGRSDSLIMLFMYMVLVAVFLFGTLAYVITFASILDRNRVEVIRFRGNALHHVLITWYSILAMLNVVTGVFIIRETYTARAGGGSAA